MELLTDSKRIVYKIFFTSLFYVIALWFSIFIYGLTYYLYIPAVAHVKPVYFQYSPICYQPTNAKIHVKTGCPFPAANVSLLHNGYYELLSQGQTYTVELTLDLPESEANREQGMFMIIMDMVSKSGEVVQSSSRPAILPYKSTLFKTIYTFFFAPCLLAGTLEEKQTLVIPIFESYREDSYRPAHNVRIEIQSRIIEIYASTIRIHAQFTGIRYFMYYWPLLSSIVGVFSNFFFISIFVFFTWLRCTLSNGSSNGAPSNGRASIPHAAPQSRPFQAGRPQRAEPVRLQESEPVRPHELAEAKDERQGEDEQAKDQDAAEAIPAGNGREDEASVSSTVDYEDAPELENFDDPEVPKPEDGEQWIASLRRRRAELAL